MKKITFQHPHRQKHFEFFNTMNHPHFNICANVDITNLLHFLKNKNLPFTPTVVYLISKTANQIPEFKWRIRGQEVVEHTTVHPSFTVYTEAADVFSFCEVAYDEDYHFFLKRAITQMKKMKTHPSFEDDKTRDDYLFLSAIPWVSFTSFQHAMFNHPTDSVPRITWGKYFETNEKIMMPLSVQAHHAVVDGRHTGKFFQIITQLINDL